MQRIRPKFFVIVCGAAAALMVSATAVPIALTSRSQSERVARAMTGGDLRKAPDILRRYGCSGCHTIPGIAGADGQVGGTLADIRRRVYVGGVANNSSENLVRWIVNPQSLSPSSAMPQTGISEAEARDAAAYLYAR